MSDSIAVCISDIHFSMKNLDVASKALKTALKKAEDLAIPLVIAGDLHDTKAIIRAEVANVLIEILSEAGTDVIILIGNHDLVNEKGSEHSLNFLSPYAHVVEFTRSVLGLNFVPYQSSPESFLKEIDRHGRLVICHQGFLGANMGDYIQDKTSVDPELVKNHTIISGHYHKHQTIGTVTYIGSPYTTSFGEANDGPKGFLILNSDGSYVREILNLRKHIIVDTNVQDVIKDCDGSNINKNDLLWVKIRGNRSELSLINKKSLGIKILGHADFKLDLIATDADSTPNKLDNMSTAQVFDSIIEDLQDTQEHKTYLKTLWRDLVNEAS